MSTKLVTEIPLPDCQDVDSRRAMIHNRVKCVSVLSGAIMSDDPTGSITLAFAQIRSGNAQGAGALWQRFFPRLVALARKTLIGRPQGMADADDAVQSAFVSFYQRAAAGEFGDLLTRDDLWKLLGMITARKALKQARREGAAKRGGGKVVGETALARDDGDAGRLAELAATMPAHDVDLCCQELIDALEEPLRPYALLRLLGYKNGEIAKQFDCTERKVERKLHLIRLKWKTAIVD
jgi:DNA-directed RNA polymerase specialized sigma24 family protein